MNIYDISEKAGVSIATVSRVLNNSAHVSQATKDKVLAVIESSGYVPNAFARGLGLNSMKTIGLLCPDAADPYLSQALAYLQRGFRARGYDCLLSCTGRALPNREQGVAMLETRLVDGMVLMGSTFIESHDKDNAYIRKAAQNAPIVLLNGSFACEGVYCVLCDDLRATADATEHLLATGCKRILYLYHSHNYSGQKKLDGYRAALGAHGIPVENSLIHFIAAEKSSVLDVRDYLAALHEKGLAFDAVLTSEDSLAIGAVKYARAHRRSIPRGLSVIGYNNSNLCLCAEPELTSVDNRLEAICGQCVDTMLGVLEGRALPQKTVYTGELVRRGSTRPLP